LRNSLKENIFYNQVKKQWGWQFILSASLLLKIFYFIYNSGIVGPDASEYIACAEIFKSDGLQYISSTSPYTLWRLPVLPLLLAICQTLPVFYVVQLLTSYGLAYYLFLIFRKLNFTDRLSLQIALFSLFVPYLNIAACSSGVEFLHVTFLVYLTKKIVYNETDYRMAIALVALCLLRPEGFIVVFFILGRNIFLKKYKPSLWLLLPLVSLFLWQVRNEKVFGSFSLVNPIMSSRAMIGSVYGYIYVVPPHPFHEKYNYYKGFDYVNNKPFVAEYKQVVAESMKKEILGNPIGYLLHRIRWVSQCFFYTSFNNEHLPDKNWHFLTTTDRKVIEDANATWAYGRMWHDRDFIRLLLRLLYNGSLLLGHLAGLIFMLFNFRRFGAVLFVFLSFGYLGIVEADMRYFIFPQLICLCIAFSMLLQVKEKFFPAKSESGI
jgi:hypothetical protein